MPTKKNTRTKTGPLKAYTQGRYRCIACGEFDWVARGTFAMPGYFECPVCKCDAQLLTSVRGMGLEPVVGVTLPGYMENRLGQIEGEGRPTRAAVGNRKRKFPNCSLCDTETFTKTGALDAADDMRKQHLKRYEIFPCPFGPGFHVQPMED